MRRIAGVTLSVLLGLVLFLPLLSLPIVGSYNASKLQEEGAPSIVIEILILAAIGVIASLFEKQLLLRLVGILSGIDVFYNYFRISNYLNDNALSKALVQYEYGWYVWAAVSIGIFTITFLKNEKAVIRLTKKCKFCYEDIDSNASICKFCKKDQFEKTSTANDQILKINDDGSWICPKCGKNNASDFTRCGECLWEKISQHDNSTEIKDTEFSRSTYEVSKEVLEKRNELWTCAKCGFDQNKGTYTKCLKCSEFKSI